jgi:hypothetical protein
LVLHEYQMGVVWQCFWGHGHGSLWTVWNSSPLVLSYSSVFHNLTKVVGKDLQCWFCFTWISNRSCSAVLLRTQAWITSGLLKYLSSCSMVRYCLSQFDT